MERYYELLLFQKIGKWYKVLVKVGWRCFAWLWWWQIIVKLGQSSKVVIFRIWNESFVDFLILFVYLGIFISITANDKLHHSAVGQFLCVHFFNGDCRPVLVILRFFVFGWYYKGLTWFWFQLVNLFFMQMHIKVPLICHSMRCRRTSRSSVELLCCAFEKKWLDIQSSS